jgi:hypothetical protein
MKIRSIVASAIACLAIGGATLAPVTIQAQNWSQHRHNMQNDWRNIAIGSGALGLLGLLNHDNTLTFVGAAGALYSYNRYDQDRRSTSRMRRLRAEYFNRPYFYRDGTRYERRSVWRHGQRYYQFVRVD